jgi:hypothetical protein
MDKRHAEEMWEIGFETIRMWERESRRSKNPAHVKRAMDNEKFLPIAIEVIREKLVSELRKKKKHISEITIGELDEMWSWSDEEGDWFWKKMKEHGFTGWDASLEDAAYHILKNSLIKMGIGDLSFT